jgi:poly(A) polymerase
MHPALEAVREATRGTPYEGQVWLVGGAVRDELLGVPHPPDFDLVLESDAHELAQLLHERGVSKLAPVIYTRFGTALVRVEKTSIELATARKESYAPESRKPEVEPATLQEDALRRDFTINTLMRNLHTEELLDPLSTGLDDLEHKILRTPRDPATTFHDDPLRMLRAVRFRWRFGLEPAPGLYEAIRAEAHRLDIISGERIHDELVKMLELPEAHRCLQDLMDLGLIARFAPELTEMVGVEQGNYHHLDVWEHSLLVMQNLPERARKDRTLMLAALLHDVGKPRTRTTDGEGRTRFFGHEELGATLTEEILRRLRFSSEEIAEVRTLVRNHMRLGSAPIFTPAAARRLIRDLGDQVPQLIQLVEADMKALRPGVQPMNLDPIKRRLAEVARETPREQLQSPLSGEEIMRIADVAPGPEVGKLKNLLVEKVLEGELAPGDKEAATRILLDQKA